MTGKFIATVGLVTIGILSATSIAAIVTSALPAANRIIGISAHAEPVRMAEITFRAPKKAQYDDVLVECGTSPGKF
jgi:hypothetical protein